MSFISDADLMALALEAREKSYSPYSHFAVGAALVDKNGNVYQGCNIEHYPPILLHFCLSALV